MKTTADRVSAVLCEVLGQKAKSDMDRDTLLLETGIIDSFDLLTLVAALEQHFGFRLATEDLTIQNFTSISTITMLVDCRLQGKLP